MASVKTQASSHRKRKEVVSDPPVGQEIGEEAVHSNSDHSDEGEERHDRDSECAPLIDPWYDICPHFPKIPGDYMSPPPGRVWLALFRRTPDVSWAPMSSYLSDLVIHQGVALPVPIHFEFGSGTSSSWKEWVNSELSDTGFMGLLQRAGVLKVVVLSRSLSNF